MLSNKVAIKILQCHFDHCHPFLRVTTHRRARCWACHCHGQHQGPFPWLGSSHQVAKLLELQHQSFQWIFRTDFLQNGLVGSPCSPRDSKESSPTPQFKSISSLVLSFLYGSTLTSIHDYWKNHSFDYTGLCQQSSLCFLICCLDWSWLFFQGANVFNY